MRIGRPYLCVLNHNRTFTQSTYASAAAARRVIRKSAYVDDDDPSTAPALKTSARLPAFQALGVKPAIAEGLALNFPNVTEPTACQSQMIPAVMSGKDVLLQNETGSGKSFGLLLALLSRLRRLAAPPPTSPSWSSSRAPSPTHTALLIVPHHNLALQMQHWARRLLPTRVFPSLAPVLSVVLRDPAHPMSEQAKGLRETPPHIIVGTPGAFLELGQTDWSALGVPTLAMIAVDEVDDVFRLPPKRSSPKERRKFHKHMPPTLALLTSIFEERPKSADARSLISSRLHRPMPPIQLLLMSATLDNQVHDYLRANMAWLSEEEDGVVHIQPAASAGPELQAYQRIKHHCLIVSESGVRDIDSAVEDEAASPPVPKESVAVLSDEEIEEFLPGDDDMEEAEVDDYLIPPLAKPGPSPDDSDSSPEVDEQEPGSLPPFDPILIETIASAFALSVPRLAMLFVPTEASLSRVVNAFAALGVNARQLDLADAKELAGSSQSKREKDDPVLLVTHHITARGLDLPDLTHVFILGPPKDRVSLVHMAGRVGRMGAQGTCVVVATEVDTDTVALDERGREEAEVYDEEKVMMRMYKSLGLQPKKFAHII